MKTAIPLSLCLTLLCSCSSPTLAQDQEIAEAIARPIALLYVQVAKGVNVYSESAAGKLTMIKGSPFAVSGQMEGITGSHLLSVGTTNLHSYAIASSGAVGRQVSSINTATYDGEDCGPTTGNQAMLDRAGNTFYVQLGQGGCLDGSMSDWQAYRIGSSGSFTFLGNSYTQGYSVTTAPVFSSNDRYGYRFTQTGQDGAWGFDPMVGFTEQDPAADPNLDYYLEPLMAAADPSEHLAVIMYPITNCDQSCLPYGTGGNVQLASYSINSSGGVESANTQADAPFVQIAQPASIEISPNGKFVAIGGQGFQVFNFNGVALPTQLSTLMLQGTRIDQLAWDGAEHLFALSYASGTLYVFSVSAQGVTQVGDPVSIPGAYGLTGIIVVNK